MKKYHLTTSNESVNMTLAYGEDDFLTRWDVHTSCPRTFWQLLWHAPPLSLGALNMLLEKNPGMFLLKEVPEDMSFVVFWEAYKHKVGNKARAEKLWNALPETDRLAALRAVPRYLYFLVQRPNMEQAFAETWLNQRRWESYQ